MKQKPDSTLVVFILHTTSCYFQIHESNSLEKNWGMEGPAGVYLQLELLPPEIFVQDQAHYLSSISFI